MSYSSGDGCIPGPNGGGMYVYLPGLKGVQKLKQCTLFLISLYLSSFNWQIYTVDQRQKKSSTELFGKWCVRKTDLNFNTIYADTMGKSSVILLLLYFSKDLPIPLQMMCRHKMNILNFMCHTSHFCEGSNPLWGLHKHWCFHLLTSLFHCYSLLDRKWLK